MIRYALIAGVISLGIAPALSCSSPPTGLECYLVQMHIHGHTNHNGADLPASMEWHCDQAAGHGFDVIWWSDHSEIFDKFEDRRISFRNAVMDEAGDFIDLGLTKARRRLSRLDLEGALERLTVVTEENTLRLSLTSGGGPEHELLRVTPASARGPIKTVSWCRPVASGLSMEVVADVAGLGEDAYLRVGFDLAAHPEGRHHLVYDIVAEPASEPEVVGDTLVMMEMEVASFPSRLVFDLEAAAAMLPDGLDNTLGSMFFEFGARNGASVEVAIDSLVLISDRPLGENQHRTLVDLARKYEALHGITQYIGVEASGIHTPQRPHMNAYFPESTETYQNLVIDPAIERREWAAGIVRQGGIVSLNHPFGAALRPLAGGVEEYDGDMSLGELAEAADPVSEDALWEVAGPIIETGGMGCGILEVGYTFRGTGALSDHLRLWDLVLANGVRLVGNGVSDAHGGIWGPDMRPNAFATWIWAEGKDRSSLLEALEAGRVCFGNPFLYTGEFSFGVEDAFMGDTLRVKRGDELTGWVRMDPWVEGADVRLVQVKIEAGREPSYIVRDEVVDPRGGFILNVGGACFARVEVYGRGGEPIMFSNPVWLIPE